MVYFTSWVSCPKAGKEISFTSNVSKYLSISACTIRVDTQSKLPLKESTPNLTLLRKTSMHFANLITYLITYLGY